MSIKSKIVTLAVAAAVVTGSVAAANAGPKFNPVVPLVGAAIVGTAIAAAATTPSYAYGPQYRRCGFQPRYNVFGQYIGSVRVCNYY